MGEPEELWRRLGTTGGYQVREVLVCRLYNKMGTQSFNVNLIYIFKDVENGTFDLEVIRSGEKFKTVRYNFLYNLPQRPRCDHEENSNNSRMGVHACGVPRVDMDGNYKS